MNNLEKALLDISNEELDYYLETETTEKIREDILDIKYKAASSTPGGVIKNKLLALIKEI